MVGQQAIEVGLWVGQFHHVAKRGDDVQMPVRRPFADLLHRLLGKIEGLYREAVFGKQIGVAPQAAAEVQEGVEVRLLPARQQVVRLFGRLAPELQGVLVPIPGLTYGVHISGSFRRLRRSLSAPPKACGGKDQVSPDRSLFQSLASPRGRDLRRHFR